MFSRANAAAATDLRITLRGDGITRYDVIILLLLLLRELSRLAVIISVQSYWENVNAFTLPPQICPFPLNSREGIRDDKSLQTENDAYF